MKKRIPLLSGSQVRSLVTGESGTVLEVIGDPADPFGYIVKTQSGIKRWVLRKSKE